MSAPLEARPSRAARRRLQLTAPRLLLASFAGLIALGTAGSDAAIVAGPDEVLRRLHDSSRD